VSSNGDAMVFVLGLFLVLGFLAVSFDSVWGLVAAYLVTGVAWLVRNRKKPTTHQIFAPPFAIIITWPMALIVEAQIMLSDPHRFSVYVAVDRGQGTLPAFETLQKFASWRRALDFARTEANRMGKEVWIQDNRRFQKTIIGTYFKRRYVVGPSGSIKKALM